MQCQALQPAPPRGPGPRPVAQGAGRRVGRWAAPPTGALGPSHELSALRPALANPHRSSRAALPLHAALPGSGSSAHDCLGWGVSRNPQPRAAGQRPSATRCLLGESAPLRRGMNCGAPVGFLCFPEYHAESVPQETPNPAPSATAPGHCGGTPASLGGPLLAGTGAICLGLDRSTWARVLLQERNWCFEK